MSMILKYDVGYRYGLHVLCYVIPFLTSLNLLVIFCGVLVLCCVFLKNFGGYLVIFNL